MTSTVSLLSFLLEGRLLLGYAAAFGAAALVGGAAGEAAVAAALTRGARARASGAVLALAALAGVGAAGSAALCGMQLLSDVRAREGLGFRSICSYT
jgi:hypothetical protein